MLEVNTDGLVESYTLEEFLKKYGMEAKKELYLLPFNKHVLHIDGKTITVTLKEN